MSGFQKVLLASAVGFAVGVVGTYGANKLQKWWKNRRRGSPSVADIKGRRLVGEDGTPLRRSLKLYHSFPFRSCRCAWLVNELGVADQVNFVHTKLHGTDARDLMAYREVHPHGTLPALAMEDGSVLLESSAICLYLAECFIDSTGQDLLPASEQTAVYYNCITYATSTFDQILDPLYMQLTHTPEEQRNHTLVENMRRKFTICANILSSVLSDQPFICGDKFTAADCVIGYNVWWASVIQNGSLLEDYPVLRQYLTRLCSRPAFQKTFRGYKKPSDGSL